LLPVAADSAAAVVINKVNLTSHRGKRQLEATI